MPRLAGAPITWGVCEVLGWGHQLARDRVLTEMVGAGLTATELGPRGFLPDDPGEVRLHLTRYGLTLVGGFVPAVLHREAIRIPQLTLVENSARTLAGAGAEVLVLAAETGSVGYERIVELSELEWTTLFRGMAAVQEIGKECELIVALHPHYGTVIESEAHIRRVLDSSTISICLDTGHLMVAGADPMTIVRLAAGRIAHVHLKDVDAALAARVRAGEIGYRDAVHQGLYRPLGDGDVNIAAIVQALRESGYAGWYVIEQDLVIDASTAEELALENATRSVRYLAEVAAA